MDESHRFGCYTCNPVLLEHQQSIRAWDMLLCILLSYRLTHKLYHSNWGNDIRTRKDKTEKSAATSLHIFVVCIHTIWLLAQPQSLANGGPATFPPTMLWIISIDSSPSNLLLRKRCQLSQPSMVLLAMGGGPCKFYAHLPRQVVCEAFLEK